MNNFNLLVALIKNSLVHCTHTFINFFIDAIKFI